MTPEIDRLRADERFSEAWNALSDLCTYQIMPRDQITNENRADLIRAGVERFGGELPLTTISGIVDRVIVKELRDRARATALRKRKPQRRVRGASSVAAGA